MFSTIVSTVLPVFGLILLGMFIKQIRFLPEPFFIQCNRFAFWIALPSLLFKKIADSQPAGTQATQLVTALFISTTAIIFISWLISRTLRLKPASSAAFIHASFRGNLAYIGLPVILFSLESDSIPNLPQAESLAVLCMAPMILYYNIVAIPILQAGTSSRTMSPLKHTLESIKNPLVIACIAGLVFSSLKIGIPGPASRMLTLIAQTALPLALLSIGASLSLKEIKNSSLQTAAASLLKTAAAPALTYLVVRMMQMDPVSARMAMLFMSTPTAVATYVMTEQMKCDASLVCSTIVFSTILSAVTMSVAIMVT